MFKFMMSELIFVGVEVAACEEVFCRGEGLALVAGGAQQAGESPPCGRVIIHYQHCSSLAIH
jgi:hypothetical protein